jgi:hypothetical protein
MSNLQSKMTGVKFEAVPERPAAPGNGALILGVIYPALVVAFELATHICAQAFFDPMPTFGHVLAAGFVPASNLAVWMHLRNAGARNVKLLAFANGAAIAVAGFYALLFLPLLPLALIGIVYAIGVLPLAPLVSFAYALRLRATFRARHPDMRLRGPLLGGLATGLAALLLLDLPPAATRLGIQWAASSMPAERERGLVLLRAWGDDDLLLRLCYGAAGRPTGLLSALVMFGGDSWLAPRPAPIASSPAQAREIYYRVHGVPFNARPAPSERGRATRFADFRFDDDHGGTQVGGRLQGLDMISSRIDGSVSGDDALAYLEWEFTYRNSGPLDREARLQLALPPGGVVSRATLWVDGEEREAAYGGRGEVRAAYQRVAVQQRRDPLLVTSKGADRVLVQAFPVPRNGGTIKFKIGISAPLDIVAPSRARLTLPALVDRNFSFAPGMSHAVWIESKQPLTVSAPGLIAGRPDAGLFRIAGAVADGELSGARASVTLDRNPDLGRLAARMGEGDGVVQDVVMSAPAAPGVLLLVIDGSARLANKVESVIRALDAIPADAKVGAIVAAEPMPRLPPGPWSPLRKQNLVKLLRSAAFIGGQDNAPALAEALQMLEPEPNATLLWIHGPQPVHFQESAAGLEQATARLSRLPRVILYAVEPGPNELLPDVPWAWSARSLPQTSAPENDLAEFFARTMSRLPAYEIRRTQAQSAEGLRRGSDHIARLWANERVLELMRTDPIRNRAAAVSLATQYQLVTPVSGAVVLETKQQYDESRLTPVSQATVPTVPEPQEWALALIACAALAWFAWRHRPRLAAVA